MLSFDDPARALDPTLLDARGGFAWWYVDALDERGDGFVLIWSWGLPFLPGDRAARLAGTPPRTGDRPSVNLVLYRKGQAVLYSLYELAPECATWTPGETTTWVFGRCQFRRTREGKDTVLSAQLDLPMPGANGRLLGRIDLSGPTAQQAEPDTGAHAWTPLTGHAQATARFEVGGEHVLSYAGPAYHDRNGSQTPLDELGIDHWTWGRTLVGDALIIHYLTWPQGSETPVFVVATVDGEGAITRHDVPAPTCSGPRRTVWGMRWWRRIELDLHGEAYVVNLDPPTDSGPFYLRCTHTTTWRESTTRGWSEWCEPERIDLPRHRWLVQMAVQRELGDESMWLPLFAGPRHDRWRRLVRRWFGAPRRQEEEA